MRPIPSGFEARLGVVVTEEMTVEFGELGALHPVYATYWMAKHFEEAGRKVILPFLEEGEEGVGSAVTVHHIAPALPGMRVEVIAVHDRTDGNRVHTRCRALSELEDLIGEGSTEQAILPTRLLSERFEDLRRRLSSD